MKAADYKSIVGVIPKEGLTESCPPILVFGMAMLKIFRCILVHRGSRDLRGELEEINGRPGSAHDIHLNNAMQTATCNKQLRFAAISAANTPRGTMYM